ncbi:MAG TPA: twin-arginine translocase subunit TatC [Chloroflexota bacterium]|nr:twin-arginine translocase subunit TatC [Chloroflexota bacterium]
MQLIERARGKATAIVRGGPLVPIDQNVPQEELEEEELEMTLVEHLDELRGRIIRAVLGLVVATAVAFVFTPQLIAWMLAPSGLGQLYFTQPAEAFLMYFQVSLMAGIGLSSPWIFIQVMAFVLPAMTRREKRIFWTALPFVVVFFVVGVLFGYFVTLPFALRYLLTFTMNGVLQPLITADSYLSFVTMILFWMGLAFELPIIIWILAKLGLARTPRLVGFRKYAILAAFIVAAVITPTPDPLNQALVAIPLWILYEIGIVFSRFA